VKTKTFLPDELDALAADLERDGICTLQGLFDAGTLRAWGDRFASLVEQRRNRPGGLAPRGAGRFYVTLPWTPPFADVDVFANPAILGVLDRVFAQEYRLVQFAVDTPVQGSEYQVTHRDYRPLFTEDRVTPLYALAVNFPLCDVTEENGPLELARGTHLMSREEGLKRLERGEVWLEPFPMKLGDVSIRTPLALHRGTPNRTASPRPMVVLGYVMHWLHTANTELNVPRAYYESLPRETRQMLRCNVVDEVDEARATETYIEFAY
jgi:hypothetical protein